MLQPLTAGQIVRGALSIGLRNAASLLGAVVLWAITLWIPYINVGTTIGLLGLVARMGRGEVVSPTAIFDRAYRKQMGEFFLVSAFVAMGVGMGMVFLLIPGLVIGLAWSLAALLVIDKGRNPTAAIQESNDLTYGHKWTMFWGLVLVSLVANLGLAVPFAVFWLGRQMANSMGSYALWEGVVWVTRLMFLAWYVALIAISLGAWAHIYDSLVLKRAPAPPAVD